MQGRARMSAGLPLRPLRPGMRIALIAPASPFPVEDFERGVARLRERYEVTHEPSILERSGYLAGSDQRRTRELIDAIEDDSVHAILAARGGYGSTRLLAELPATCVAAHPKPLIGFSDVTALHALWARAGLGSIHGSMAAALGRMSEPLLARWLRAAEGQWPAQLNGLEVLAQGHGRTSGLLFGGNLTVLTALIGTPHAPELSGRVVFLEDQGERPYRIDRMLTSWRHAGWLAAPRAFVLGGFTDCAAGADGVSARDVLAANLGQLGVPVLWGVPAGHVEDNLELPLGALVEVDPQRGSLSFEAGAS